MNWEQIDNYTQRAKVFGGWIVKSLVDVVHNLPDRGMQGGYDCRESICFVPDKNYEWVLEPIKNS